MSIKKFIKSILSCCCLFIGLHCYSQPKQLRFNRLSVENGLPSNYITQIIQDKAGYMWVGTQGGLVRYDGYQVKSYKLKNSKSLSIKSIYEDHAGRLWIHTDDKLFQYDRSVDSFTSKESISRDIFSIQDDPRGNIWLASSQEIYCLNPNKGIDSILHFSIKGTGKNKIDASTVNSVFADIKGRIWVGTDSGLHYYDSLSGSLKKYIFLNHDLDSKNVVGIWGQASNPGILWIKVGEMKDSMAKNVNIMFTRMVARGIIRIDLKTRSFTTYQTDINESYTIGLYEDSKNRIWMGTSSGLSIFDNTTERFINYSDGKTSTPVYEIKEDPGGNFWCYTTNSLLFFNIRTKTFTRYNNDEHEPNTLRGSVNIIFMDNQGTLWIGTSDQGLHLANWQRSRFTLYENTSNHNYTGGTTFDFAESNDGTIWVASYNGLYQWMPETDRFKKIDLLKHKEDPLNVLDVMVDKEGVVWCSVSMHGLFSYNPVTGVIKNYRYNQKDTTSLGGDIVSCILEDRSGTIWAGSESLCSYNRGSDNFTRIGGTDFIMSLCEDQKGELLAATLGGEIKKLDKIKKTFVPFQKDTSMPGLTGLLYEDKQNNLWQASSEGLFLSNPKNGTLQKFSDKDGLFYDQVKGISGDAQGNIWVNGLRGIFVYNPLTKLFRNISTANGLPENQLDGKSFISKEGKIFIGCHDGFIVFDPHDFKADGNAPLVSLETLNYKTKSAGNSEKDTLLRRYGHANIHLRYNENRVNFNYVGLYYQNSSLIQYAYKLDGYDPGWIQAGSQKSATYTNLSPGTYTFHVKAANSDGVWSKQDDSIIIIISPPWWKTWWAYITYILIGLIAIWTFIRGRTRSLKKEKVVLEQKVSERTMQLKEEKELVETTLAELKATQAQLIQSEKMASLGELTAGIAHEIQNPLNFVNNFSEVNKELIEEVKSEKLKDKSERNDELEMQLLNDIDTNLEKISHHGKRADAIVKGMLQHSRTSSGQKELADINALADEYLRLAYHGLRAKDKDFNAQFQSNFDPSLPKINVVPQEIGRVILNLINNAFYAVSEKKKQAGDGYEPTVIVTTKLIIPPLGGQRGAEIRVRDNGTGIPQKILDKIFQPFFTTKPTGEGTGLGLSLAYDIIKAHGGEIKVKTGEQEGTMFTIILPISN